MARFSKQTDGARLVGWADYRFACGGFSQKNLNLVSRLSSLDCIQMGIYINPSFISITIANFVIFFRHMLSAYRPPYWKFANAPPAVMPPI